MITLENINYGTPGYKRRLILHNYVITMHYLILVLMIGLIDNMI